MTTKADEGSLPIHGATVLPSVRIDSYNLEIADDDGFVGDKASKGAFQKILDDLRKTVRALGEDPLGKTPTDAIGKRKLDALLLEGSAEAAGVVQGAVEEFAQQLARVIRRFLQAQAWHDTQSIVIGGGFSSRRVGELAIGRCGVILKADAVNVDIGLIDNDPDEAGLIGVVHLLPPWVLRGHEAILGVDVGGTNIRVGLVGLKDRDEELPEPAVLEHALWRHGDEDVGRNEAVEKLIGMLSKMIKRAKKDELALAPVIGIGCPGVISRDGFIDRGAQNLPGNWEASRFNLPSHIRQEIPTIGGHETLVVMHNDAVVQGLSELPRMRDRRRWGVLTIGTGLGNARFTNRAKKRKQKT